MAEHAVTLRYAESGLAKWQFRQAIQPGRAEIVDTPEWWVRERWFMGAVSLRAGSSSYDYPNCPMLDFGMSLNFAIFGAVSRGASEMQPSGATKIKLATAESSMAISRPGSEHVDFIDLVALLRELVMFMRSVLDESTKLMTELLINDNVERLYREWGVRELGEDQFRRHAESVKVRNRLRI